MSSPLKVAIVCLTALAVGTGCCCCCPDPMTPEERAAWEQEQAEKKAAAEAEKQAAIDRGPARAESWATIHQVIPQVPRTDTTKCPDELLKAELDDPPFRETLMSMDYYGLPGAEKDMAEWDFLESGDSVNFGRWVDHPDDSESTRLMWQESMGEKKNRFLVVLVPDQRGLAEGFDEGGFFTDGGFTTAYFEGAVAVVDLDDRAILCSAPISVENSEIVEYDEDGLFGTTMEQAVQADFEQNLEDKTNEALKTMSGHLKVNTVGIF